MEIDCPYPDCKKPNKVNFSNTEKKIFKASYPACQHCKRPVVFKITGESALPFVIITSQISVAQH